jgi:hypothetical protein
MTDQTKVDTTVLKLTTVAFFTAEFNEIHALMDGGNVPREFNGEKLTAAQRVRWYYHTREAADAAIRTAQGKKTKH